MYYIVFDLEWNQGNTGKHKSLPEMPFEIIEIGAVKLNEKKELVDEFHTLIRPVVYPKLHFQIKKVLHKTIQDFASGCSFSEAASDFFEWCGDDYQFCTWGPSDLTELQRNLKYFEVPVSLGRPLLYYDVQKLFSIAYEDRKSRRTLEHAVDALSIEKEDTFHSALSDARYTAKVLSCIETALIKGNYSIDCYRPPQTKKEEIYAVFEGYSKYISRTFESREQALADKEVTSTRCYLCGKPARKKIRWFTPNSKHYYCQCYCEHHGFLKGKLTMKTTDDGQVFLVKILKLVSPEEADYIRQKQEALRKKRKEKRKQKRKEATNGSNI